MTTAQEALGGRTPLGSALAAGLDTLSVDQEVTFTRYLRTVLPLDGFVFWVRSDLVIPTQSVATIGNLVIGQSRIGMGGNYPGIPNLSEQDQDNPVVPSAQLRVSGSLHFTTDRRQDEAESFSVNKVVFTSEDEIQDLNAIGPNVLYLAEFCGTPSVQAGVPTPTPIRFAFSQRGSFYGQTGLYHYVGDAVYSFMETQIIDSVSAFSNACIVSNSLPFWLAMNNYQPYAWEQFGNTIPLYPSYLSPANMAPPFAAVHVDPRGTEAMASAAFFGKKSSSHSQLCKDRVEVTLYGIRNDQALDFVDFVNQFSINIGFFGITNIPTVRDERVPQNELGVIAQKKTVSFEVSYHQTRANDVARQLIESVIPTFIPSNAA